LESIPKRVGTKETVGKATSVQKFPVYETIQRTCSVVAYHKHESNGWTKSQITHTRIPWSEEPPGQAFIGKAMIEYGKAMIEYGKDERSEEYDV
jgi:hypothetical protein